MLLVYLEIFGTMRVQTVEEGRGVQAVDVYGRLVGKGFTFFIRTNLMNQPYFFQFVQDASGQPDGDFSLFGQLFGGVGRSTGGESFGDERHDEYGHKVVVTSADVACVGIEAEVADVLSGIS